MARKSRKNIDAETTAPVSQAVCYNAAAYTRLSCDDKKKRGDSLETQRNIIENYVAATPDMRVVGVYSDNNATGTNFDRPGFQRMMTDIEQGRVNCIIVKDLTRFGRNAIDGGYYLEKVLPSLGVRFIAVTDSYDSNEPNNGLLLPLKNIISESYALDIGRKVKAIHQQNIADGRYVGRLAPYGYLKSPDDCHKLIVDEDSASVVRQIFGWASDGVSVHEISKRLTSSGSPTPSYRNYAKGLSKATARSSMEFWQPTTVKGMLEDRVYVGDMVQGKTRSFGGRQVKVEKAEWVCVANTHEPIIDSGLFELVQQLRQGIHEQTLSKKTTPFSPHIFKGKIYCDHCGRVMHRKRQNKDGTYWVRCVSRGKYGEDVCGIVSVKEETLRESILEALRLRDAEHTGERLRFEQATLPRNGVTSAIETELKEVNRELCNTGRFIKSLYESLVNGIITQDEFSRLKQGYETRIETLTNRADELCARCSEIDARKAAHDGYAEAVSASVNMGGLDERIVDALIEKIIVRSDKSFEIHYRFDAEIQKEAA